MAAEMIFWITAGLVLWAYLLYPTIVFLSAGCKKPVRLHKDNSELPFVSVLMAVYNEEKVLVKKITSLLESDYPADNLEIIIGSDASDDGTDEIIRRFISDDSRICFYRSDERVGKSSIINQLASRASGEIFIITDANVFPSKNTIRLLAARFSAPDTGLCDATVVTIASTRDGIVSQENLYSRLETALKRAEGEAWGTMTGPYGGFYAVRRKLLPLIPANMLADDLFVGLNVLRNGFSAINEPEATVMEDTQYEIKGQFRRRVRIAAGAFQNLFYYGPFPGKRLLASFSFFSHKVIRWFSPWLLALVFMTTVILSGHSIYYFCLLAAQLFFIFLTALDLFLNHIKINLAPLRFATQFMMMNIALAAGFIKALKGIKKGIWEPTKRF